LDVLVTISTALISAVPIVDENGDLVASFSASDLRGMIQENFSSFMLTVEEYLKTHSPRTLEPLTATSTETLKELLAKMLNQDSAGYRRHRVWIVEGKKPIGVFSMTDVMKIIRDNDQL
jgi:CBS domain-containing protein